jgi:hypothetical protein
MFHSIQSKGTGEPEANFLRQEAENAGKSPVELVDLYLEMRPWCPHGATCGPQSSANANPSNFQVHLGERE